MRNFLEQMKYPSLVTKKISELSPAKYNPRKITSDALGRLTKSLSELGNLQPITWNAKTGNIVGGHQRLKCYSALGKDEIEVWAVWLDEAQEKAANLALNKLSGEFDVPMLKDILEELGSLTPAHRVENTADAADTAAENPLLSLMGHDPISVDQLQSQAQLTPGDLMAVLLTLELDGQLQKLPDGRYQRLN